MVVRSKAGKNKVGKKGIVKIRRTSSSRTNCPACIRLRTVNGDCYQVYQFLEFHNHEFVRPEDRHLLLSARQLNFTQQSFIHKAGNVNIGHSRAHNLIKKVNGRFEHIGATKVDFKNLRRDIRLYIENNDAQMLIDKLKRKHDEVPGFSMQYKSNDDGVLHGVFWADAIAKSNYDAFGDVVSFDATYRPNQHSMVFVPFIGINNHKKCVTFGAGLISRENVESYKWLMQTFLTTMGTEPTFVFTDQEPTAIQVFDEVFKTARHRFCMWHITSKLEKKVGSRITNDEAFMRRFNNVVRNKTLDANEFETKWSSLMHDFKFTGHEWFCDLYDDHEKWIPSFSYHLSMGGLMRPTSRSESENSFFGCFTNSDSTLIELYTQFESAMITQREEQRLLDVKTRETTPGFKTKFKSERQAAQTFSRIIFLEYQNEIYKYAFSCMLSNAPKEHEDGGATSTVVDVDTNVEFQVVLSQLAQEVSCSCKLFERLGLLCQHALFVQRLHGLDEIPPNYVVKRWTKDIVPTSQPDNLTHTPTAEGLILDMNSFYLEILSFVAGDTDAIHEGIDMLQSFKDNLKKRNLDKSLTTKNQVIESLIGSTIPTNVSIHAPTGLRNKGSQNKKRLISKHEKAVTSSNRKKHVCKFCGKLTLHDSCNCPKKNAEK